MLKAYPHNWSRAYSEVAGRAQVLASDRLESRCRHMTRRCDHNIVTIVKVADTDVVHTYDSAMRDTCASGSPSGCQLQSEWQSQPEDSTRNSLSRRMRQDACRGNVKARQDRRVSSIYIPKRPI